MEYRVIRHEQSDDYMEHGLGDTAKNVYSKAKSAAGSAYRRGRQKGVELKNHMYKARAWIGDKWRYAYTEAELAAMRNWGKGRQAVKKAQNIVSGKYAEDVRKREQKGNELFKKGTQTKDKSQLVTGARVASEARSKKNSLAYKVSDIMGGGIHSETAQSMINRGKSTVKSLLSSASNAYGSAKNFGSTKLSEAKAYASKGKEFIQSLPDWSKTKAQNANAMVKEKTGVDVWDTAKRVGNKVKTEITEKPEHIKNLYEQTRSDVGDYAREGRRRAGEAVDSAKSYLGDKANKVKNVYEQARSDAGDIAREGKRMAGEAVTSAKKAGKAAWDYAKPGGTFNQKYVQALEKIPGGSKVVSLANSAKDTADKLSDSIADFARSNYRYATDSDYRKLTKEVKTAQKQLSSVQSQIAELKAESAKLGPTALPEGYNAIYALQEQEKALTSQINRANSVLDEYDED